MVFSEPAYTGKNLDNSKKLLMQTKENKQGFICILLSPAQDRIYLLSILDRRPTVQDSSEQLVGNSNMKMLKAKRT